MILEKIRTIFPEINRTEEQDLLIGSTCLALTDQERDTIENLNFTRYESSLDKDKRKDLCLRVMKPVANAQWWGKVSGFTTGIVSLGTAAWYLADLITDIEIEIETWYLITLPSLAIMASGVIGGCLGSIAGKKVGENIGYKRAIKNVTNTLEFIRWKDEKYATVILPALSRYVNSNQGSKKNFDELVNNYNSKVLAQQFIVDLAKERSGFLIEEQAEKIVRFYSMTQRQRTRIKNTIEAELLNIEDISDIELEEAHKFLTAATKLPRLLMTTE